MAPLRKRTSTAGTDPAVKEKLEGAPMPQRSATVATTATTATTNATSDDEVMPESDYSDATKILLERLQAWKHLCGYLENYIAATQKYQKSQSKEFEKILKTVNEPLKESHHFVQANGGVISFFDTLRNNTQGLANLHLETEKDLKTNVLSILEQLHNEVKSKAKELKSGAHKAAKRVAKATASTQKHIELLGQYTAAYDASIKGKIDCAHDPYLLCRGVAHHLSKQVNEENEHLQEVLMIQNSFQQFEAHVIQTVQNALSQFSRCMGTQCDRQRAIYAEIAGVAQYIPPDFEWANFYERNDASLLNPNTPLRTMSNITFPNQDHRATKPLVSGILERKSRAMLKGYSPGFYVITPAGYLHGFKETDEHDPDISLYLPDCTIGAFDELKFSVKGKDVSSGKVGNAFHMSMELHFKAPTKNDAEMWANVLTTAPWGKSSGTSSQLNSPTGSRHVSDAHPLTPPSEASPPLEGGKREETPSSVDGQEDGTIPVKLG